jgi:hypothetical protein
MYWEPRLSLANRTLDFGKPPAAGDRLTPLQLELSYSVIHAREEAGLDTSTSEWTWRG